MRVHESELSVDAALNELLAMQELFKAIMERRARVPRGEPTRLQCFMLREIAKAGAMPMGELVLLLEVGPATASQLVRTMESRGWLERSFDPLDRRRHVVHATSSGQEVLLKVQDRQRLRLQRVLEGFTGSERARLVCLAQRLGEVLAKPEMDGPPL